MSQASGFRRQASGFVLVLVLVAGCSPRRAVTTCADDLTGAYDDAAGKRWMVLDHGATLEAYPVFDDALQLGDVLAAPRVLDLQRTPGGLTGMATRRFARRADACESHAPVQIRACSSAGLDVSVADPPPPTSLAPCTPAPALPARSERWRRDP